MRPIDIAIIYMPPAIAFAALMVGYAWSHVLAAKQFDNEMYDIRHNANSDDIDF